MSYQGKYPDRVKASWLDFRGRLVVETNNGYKYQIFPNIDRAPLPKLGQELHAYLMIIDGTTF